MTDLQNIKARSLARIAAIQSIYAVRDMIANESKDVSLFYNKIIHRLSENKKPFLAETNDNTMSEQLFTSLCVITYANLQTITPDILLQCKNTAIEIDDLDIAILICGVAELQYLDTPRKVVINEYIEIAKFFDTDFRFINGILDTFNAVKQLEVI